MTVLGDLANGQEPYRRRVHFYETDCMGVVHHSNYLRYYEEARLIWYNERRLDTLDWGDGGRANFAVIETGVKHIRPTRFNDIVQVRLQIRLEGTRVRFQYAMTLTEAGESSREAGAPPGQMLSTGFTLHVPLNSEMKIVKPPKELIDLLQEEPWTETWP